MTFREAFGPAFVQAKAVSRPWYFSDIPDRNNRRLEILPRESVYSPGRKPCMLKCPCWSVATFA